MLTREQDYAGEDLILDGFYVGVVSNNHDPDNWGRVKVVFPWMDNTTESNWARLATKYAGNDRGNYWVPEIGDEVLVVFEHGDIDLPYVIGSLWNGKDPLPEPGHPDGKNNHKVIETRCGHKLTFDDTEGNEVISLVDCSLNNRFVIDVKSDSITVLAATGDIHIRAPAGSINFKSRTMAVQVVKTKDHSSGQTHDITVTKGHYTETVDKTKQLTVGAKLSRTAKNFDIQASSSTTSSGGSLEMGVKQAGIMVQKGAVTQTMGKVERKVEVDLDCSPVKTWTCGMSTFHSDSYLSVDAKLITIMSGVFDISAKMGQLSLLGSPVIHLGGLITLKADQVAFKPGG